MSARVRTDVVDVFVARVHHDAIEFLQLRRVEEPLRGTWQPIMGHTHDTSTPSQPAGETSLDAAIRELKEEVGLAAADALAMWALEQVHPYYIARSDCVMLSPRFAVLVPHDWTPVLNEEHDAFRWVRESDVAAEFVWPGQRACCVEICDLINSPDSPAARVQRIVINH